MREISIPVFNIEVKFDIETQTGSITSDFKNLCPYCGAPDCYHGCEAFFEDRAMTPVKHWKESEDEMLLRMIFNSKVDAIQSLILSHALAGVDIQSLAYIEGIESAFIAIENN